MVVLCRDHKMVKYASLTWQAISSLVSRGILLVYYSPFILVENLCLTTRDHVFPGPGVIIEFHQYWRGNFWFVGWNCTGVEREHWYTHQIHASKIVPFECLCTCNMVSSLNFLMAMRRCLCLCHAGPRECCLCTRPPRWFYCNWIRRSAGTWSEVVQFYVSIVFYCWECATRAPCVSEGQQPD